MRTFQILRVDLATPVVAFAIAVCSFEVCGAKIPVPEDTGVYIGTGVYEPSGTMIATGFCFTYWVPPTPTYDRVIDICAREGVGNVYITGPDFENPDADCDWIVCSYFPDEGKIYLLNLDYEHERKCVLQPFGDKEFVTLKPAEFRIIESVKLDKDEKLNAE